MYWEKITTLDLLEFCLSKTIHPLNIYCFHYTSSFTYMCIYVHTYTCIHREIDIDLYIYRLSLFLSFCLLYHFSRIYNSFNLLCFTPLSLPPLSHCHLLQNLSSVLLTSFLILVFFFSFLCIFNCTK